jgi:hypothetical protein
MSRFLRLALPVLSAVGALPLTACGFIFGEDPPPPPPDQATFVAVEGALKSAFEDTGNDVVKAKLEEEWRYKDSCALIKAPDFENWTGIVSSVDPQLVIDIGGGITLKDQTGSQPKVSGVDSGLDKGDPVRISGRFVSDDATCSAQYVGAPWNDRAIERPAYTVQLVSVERVSGH